VHPESKSRLQRRLLPALLLLAVAWTAPGCSQPPPLELVDEVDLVRYQGLWHEVALLPNRFQSRCAANTTAEYALKVNGRIGVTNRCRTAEGEFTEAEGEARPVDRDRPAALEVRFAPKWLSLLPLVWGDYQIMALDEGYRWAMVGAPSRDFLWILSREPSLPGARLDALLAEAARQGFDTDAVQRSPQEWP